MTERAVHTAGPWAVEASRTGKLRVAQENGIRVIVCDMSGDPTDPIVNADARLIAAAPTLVAELDAAAVALEEAANVLAASLPSFAAVVRGHASAARLAIATARGEG